MNKSKYLEEYKKQPNKFDRKRENKTNRQSFKQTIREKY